MCATKHKIGLVSRDDQGCRLSVQHQEENGQRGKAEKLYFSQEEIGTCNRQEFLQHVEEVMNGNEPRTQPAHTPEHDATLIPIKGEEQRELFQKIVEFMKKYPRQIIAGIAVLAISTLIGFTMVGSSSAYQLQQEIEELRSQREAEYTQCIASCEAQRTIYDAEVTIRKSKLELQ